MLVRAPRFWPNARCWSAQAVRNLARIYCGGRVANYRPFVARNIINHFSRRGDVVLDFSAGYGGRLLGCLSLDERTYIGIDPARKQVIGLRGMNDDLKTRSAVKVDIVEGCAEDVVSGMSSNSVDLIFSSPPFFNLEIYSDEPTQSSNRYPTYQEWRMCFLDAVITQSRRVLRRGVIPIGKSEPSSIVWREPPELSSILASPSEAHVSDRFIFCLVLNKAIDSQISVSFAF